MGFSPPHAVAGGTSRTAQLFALAEQYDLQGLEAAFEGMQGPSRPGTARQPTSPVAAAAAGQPDAPDNAAGDTGGRHTWQASQTLPEASSITPAQGDALPVSNSTAVMEHQPSQVLAYFTALHCVKYLGTRVPGCPSALSLFLRLEWANVWSYENTPCMGVWNH